MTKKSGQTIEYLENEDETKSLFHYFERLSLKQLKQFFLEGGSATLRQFSMRNFAVIISSIPLQITACVLF